MQEDLAARNDTDDGQQAHRRRQAVLSPLQGVTEATDSNREDEIGSAADDPRLTQDLADRTRWCPGRDDDYAGSTRQTHRSNCGGDDQDGQCQHKEANTDGRAREIRREQGGLAHKLRRQLHDPPAAILLPAAETFVRYLIPNDLDVVVLLSLFDRGGHTAKLNLIFHRNQGVPLDTEHFRGFFILRLQDRVSLAIDLHNIDEIEFMSCPVLVEQGDRLATFCHVYTPRRELISTSAPTFVARSQRCRLRRHASPVSVAPAPGRCQRLRSR